MAHLQMARDGLHNLWSRLAVALPAVQPSPFPAMPTALPSLRSVAKFALGGAQLALFPKDNAVLGGAPLACSNPVLSCHNTTSIANTCCFNSPGGLLLQTQFWDTSPSTGPSNSWTIHGLWPDHCDGTFSANCDASRAYTNISDIISAAGQTTLLDYMNTYWKNVDGTDESFWEHEWAKHGTCISTLKPSCFTNYQPQEEVVDFFNRTVELFKTLDSYSFLSAAGIVPSSSATYTSAKILAALKAPRGVSPAIQCKSGALDEIWYFFNVKGSVITGTFVPSEPSGASSTCPTTGIRYLPKSGSPAPTTSLDPSPTTTSSSPTTTNGSSPTSNPGTPFTGEGHLIVTNGGSQIGCIISGGKWYVGGTCATFTATASGDGSTLVSSKGPCAVTDGTLSCASGNTATVFGNDGSDDLTVDGSSAFYASAVPSGSTQETVTTSVDTEELTITWQAT